MITWINSNVSSIGLFSLNQLFSFACWDMMSEELLLHFSFNSSFCNINNRRSSRHRNSLSSIFTGFKLIFRNTVHFSHDFLAKLLKCKAIFLIVLAQWLNQCVIGIVCLVSSILPTSVLLLSFLCKCPLGFKLLRLITSAWYFGSCVNISLVLCICQEHKITMFLLVVWDFTAWIEKSISLPGVLFFNFIIFSHLSRQFSYTIRPNASLAIVQSIRFFLSWLIGSWSVGSRKWRYFGPQYSKPCTTGRYRSWYHSKMFLSKVFSFLS